MQRKNTSITLMRNALDSNGTLNLSSKINNYSQMLAVLRTALIGMVLTFGSFHVNLIKLLNEL